MPGQTDRVDRHVTADGFCGRLGRSGRRVDLRLVVQLDDLRPRDVPRRFGREPDHQNGSDREVRRVEDRDTGFLCLASHRVRVPAARSDDARHASLQGSFDVPYDDVWGGEVDHSLGCLELDQVVACLS